MADVMPKEEAIGVATALAGVTLLNTHTTANAIIAAFKLFSL